VPDSLVVSNVVVVDCVVLYVEVVDLLVEVALLLIVPVVVSYVVVVDLLVRVP
jgi:hypothetical protein